MAKNKNSHTYQYISTEKNNIRKALDAQNDLKNKIEEI